MYVAKYKDLLGVECKVDLRRWDEAGFMKIVTFDVYVAQIDFAKGITIKYMEPGKSVGSKENNAVCVNRLHYPTVDEYRIAFNRNVKEIRSGHIKKDEEEGGTEMQSCAFQ